MKLFLASYYISRMARKGLTSVEVKPEALERIRAYAARYGERGPLKEVLTRLLTWFSNQPDSVKTSIMGWVDAGMEQAYADALRNMADELAPDRRPVGEVFNRQAQHRTSQNTPKLPTPLTPEQNRHKEHSEKSK